ncbi:MAG TPA: hypothetical protein VEA41_14810 [Salinarimonas sp.]|nr:hypothetical protein [Salinarimonas sp.]
MTDPFLAGLLIKMVTSAVIVVAASLVVERAGPFMGAMVATLPISAGPAFAYLAYEHGPAFLESAALVSLAANVATAFFIGAYAHVAQRHGPAPSLAAAFAAWGAAALLVTRVEWTLPAALALNGVAFAAAILATRRLMRVPPGRAPGPPPWWALPLRAAGVMALVALVVISGRLIGPAAAGVAALFPVVLTSLSAVLHPRLGGPATAAVMANGLTGMLGFTLGLAVLQATAVPLGSTAALLAALTLCVVWNVGLTAGRRLRMRAAV